MSSKLQINRNTLEKLSHESTEIRLRTLDQIANKLERALALNEKVDVKSVELCKQLIRWFGFSPIRAPLKVLNVLKALLQSSHYGEKVIKRMGPDRLEKELRKVKILLSQETPELKVIQEIFQILRMHDQTNREYKENDDLEDVIDTINQLNMQGEDTPKDNYNTEDYEIPWSSPTASDYTSMKFMADILVNPSATPMEIQHAVQHLHLTMRDYPAEYLLQTPHIFRILLEIYDEQQNIDNQKCPLNIVASALCQFLTILEKRLLYRKKSLCFPYSTPAKSAEDLSTLSQLKVEKALYGLLDASISHLSMQADYNSALPVVWEIIRRTLHLHGMLKKPIEDLHLHKIATIISKICVKYSETEHCTLLRLYQIQLVFLLQDIAQINVLYNPLQTVEVFEPILRDYSLKSLYHMRHKKLQELLWKNDRALNEKYQVLDTYEKFFKEAIRLLMGSSTSAAGTIRQSSKISLVLDKLQSKQLIDVLFKSVLDAIPLYLSNNELKIEAIQLLLKLLNISFIPLRTYMYEKLTSVLKRHIGCLMNGESYVTECANTSLLAAGIIGVPLNSNLLLHIVNSGFECSEDKIQNCCFKIIELLLQSQSLFASKWDMFVSILVPVLPLLNCCCFSKKVMDLLLKLFDPDARHLPYVSVLQGNIGFLFHAKSERRSEALTRLIYTMNSLKGSDKYMPNLLHISDTLPNDICMLTAPREYRHIFNDISPARADAISSLNNLFQLLDSPDVEPLIRKTTLMQINVLCSNWHMTGEVCSSGASFLILQALENSLQHSSCVDYPDSAIPAISILNKILLYDSSVRCELSETPNIYILLLRALMMFHHDIQVRQDATMCLFQLVYHHQLIVTKNRIDGPLILRNVHMPIDIDLSAAIKCNIEEEDIRKLSSLFATAQEETQYWRFVIADTSCNSLANITQKSISKQSEFDIKEDLKLTNQDIRLLRATQPGVSLQRLVKAATNATDHRSLIHACSMLNQQLLIPRLQQTFVVDAEPSQTLSNMLNKYLQLQPSNSNDLELYEHLLDVLENCLKIPLVHIASGFIKILHKDIRHAFITMITQQEEIPINIYLKITSLLEHLISHHKEIFDRMLPSSECSAFFSNLFDLLVERCLHLFEARDLQRVRCLLSLLLALTSCHLDMPDKLLFYYCRRFIQLSLALKSFTQTGSQWHRDCLLAILQLSRQMENSKMHFRLSSGVVKYLSGLCSHIDARVRILAWSILYIVSDTVVVQTEADNERKSSDCSGPDMLLNELSYLPGGYMACCMSTLLDINEIIRVRQLAGQLFANLIHQQKEIVHTEQLLQQHGFIDSAGEALNKNVFILSDEIPEGLDPSNAHITTCELISCYTRICIEIALRSPGFLNEICTRSFMFKLYETFKQPLPSTFNLNAYIDMVADVCRLYAMCYNNNFIFLQRTICRDPVWLDCLCKIVFELLPITIEPSKIVDMLQLLMVLFKDPTGLEQLTTKMMEYSSQIVTLFQYSFSISHLSSLLQRCMLSVLSLLCIKGQPEVGGELSCNVLLLINGNTIASKGTESYVEVDCNNKENRCDNTKKKCMKVEKEKNTTSTISEHLCISLIRLFTHLYPLKTCKFVTAPRESHQQVVETLSLLLKVSPNAQETAHNLKLHDLVVTIFKAFFDEFSTTSSTTYVKRHGENKKLAVVTNLQLLFKFLLNWHSCPTMMITDDVLAIEYSRIIIQIWPWLIHSSALKLTVLQVAAFLCERSLVMCKRFSSINNSSFAHSVLKLTIKLTMAETLKIKASNTDCYPVISSGLRVLMNCCSSVEGRTALNKAHVTDMFDSLYPFNTKAARLKPDIVNAWLTFWEILSRYEEGAQAHHLNAMCSVINRCKAETRLLSLRILRNMSFLNGNRIILLTSTDFIYTINEIISQPIAEKSSVEEQLIVCVALWKLISGGVKFVAMIRGTKLSKQLRLLRDSVRSFIEEKNEKVKFGKDLLNVLDTIFKIFEC